MICRHLKVVLSIVNNLNPFPTVKIKVEHIELSQTLNGSQHHIQSYNFNLKIPESTPLFVKLVNNSKVTQCFLNLDFEEA